MAAPDLKIPIICGPTACGKTSIALDLCQDFPLEIISADSRQIYRKLNIGTAKPSAQEQKDVQFHLIDIIDPGEKYSAFRFIDDATTTVKKIHENSNLPIVVGGTGLYLKALTDGVVEVEMDDFTIRDELEKEWEESAGEKLYDLLQKVDPLEAAKIHRNNKFRIIRALEIYRLTGKSKSELMTTGAYRKSEFSFEYFCLLPDRKVLYEVINQRVDQMVSDGLIDEINELIDLGLQDSIKISNVIGYNEILDYLNGNLSLDDAVISIKQNTRRYAKRQYTWFRHQINGIKCNTKEELTEAVYDRIRMK